MCFLREKTADQSQHRRSPHAQQGRTLHFAKPQRPKSPHCSKSWPATEKADHCHVNVSFENNLEFISRYRHEETR